MKRLVTLVNRRGLHARAAAKIATLSERYAATVEVGYDDQFVPAASIMGLMLLGAGCGAQLVLTAEGAEADAAVAAIADLIAAGFDEQD